MNFFRQMNRRAVAASAVSAGLLIPLGILGAPALAGSSSSSNAYQYQYKVAVCHKTHSKKHPWHAISVGAPAVKAHLKHGDFLITPTAPCPPVAPAAPTTTSTSSTHGNSGNHGNSGYNGNNGKAKGHGK
jgi:hypothetical protein